MFKSSNETPDSAKANGSSASVSDSNGLRMIFGCKAWGEISANKDGFIRYDLGLNEIGVTEMNVKASHDSSLSWDDERSMRLRSTPS